MCVVVNNTSESKRACSTRHMLLDARRIAPKSQRKWLPKVDQKLHQGSLVWSKKEVLI